MVGIVPWRKENLSLLFQLNSPLMTEHLGGPETEEQVYKRHERYLEIDEKGKMYCILYEGKAAGAIGYWETVWKGSQVYESGWSVVPEFQGKGIASKAVKLVLKQAAGRKKHQFLHAFPSADNPASNAICRKAGFTLLSDCEFEYPPGNWMTCNDWQYALQLEGTGIHE